MAKGRAARTTNSDDAYGPTNIQRTFDALSPTELMTARDVARIAGIRKTAAIQAIIELIDSGDVEQVHSAPTYRLTKDARRPLSIWDRITRKRKERFSLEAAAALRENARLSKKF